MSDKFLMSKSLKNALGKNPESAERFQLNTKFEVDILQFNDRPYMGVNSIITNGVSQIFPNENLEFVFTFNPSTVLNGIDLNAFIVTYLQLHFLKNKASIKIGDYFKVPGILMRGYNFVGVYTTSPCYFPDDFFTSIHGAKYLWLIPIFETEFKFINKYGANKFESCLLSIDPDLSRLDRLPIVCEQ